ncbi:MULTISPECIES: capsular polysaccharide biosynthesis protein [Campylobacter]|uniref:capsular polysaccharide biosynthesis protein n=1 Tax=Campylobacter TaxID=194 RepID=UPI000A2FA0D1|nr:MULTISPECIES: capsular polysaccharide biosynthesis protein [unclassified Campylobacter]ARR04615.1 capsular polysaccharide export protein (two domain) [Campylobacter sp. RM12175]MCR8701981.1 capsular polysaccharide biosynthesis protein [Campylobacter sp. RM12176]
MKFDGYSSSINLIKNVKYFYNIKKILQFTFVCKEPTFYGWGRKESGKKAIELSTKFNGKFKLLEDGFIRSVGLGVDGAKLLSIVEDDIGIYYDATSQSRLEKILSEHKFDNELLQESKWCIDFITTHNISKYNNAPNISKNLIQKYELENSNNILIIAQTDGDASLVYGLGDKFSTIDMIDAAIKENPNSNILLKIHPDVLSGKKKSDINISNLDSKIKIIAEDINPISLLKYINKVYTKTSGMGFEALMCGCECVCFGMPFYAGWGLSDDRVQAPSRRNRTLSIEELFAGAYILYAKYIDAYTGQNTTLKRVLPQINTLKNARLNECKKQKFLFGFSVWKRKFMKPFLGENLNYISVFNKNPLKSALKAGLDTNSLVYIWGKKEYLELQKWCDENSVNIIRVEDGFIRSVGLGSDLTRPYSLVFDDVGIYFDTTSPSRLENILNYHKFSSSELEAAKKLKDILIDSKISKYNDDKDGIISSKNGKKIALVIGQVEDDASVRIGADGMKNIELLEQARLNSPNSHIIYKPHPDVVSGNRIGLVDIDQALKYCDEVLEGVSMPTLLDLADEIHTMTSTSGLEAILRGKRVICYGRPFWAGWGLSDDKKPQPRRYRSLSNDELVAGAYLLYPKYVHPINLKPCNASDLILALQEQRAKLQKPVNALLHKIKSLYARVGQKILYIVLFMVKR